jgi:electron transfer flavoprotein beta subunit
VRGSPVHRPLVPGLLAHRPLEERMLIVSVVKQVPDAEAHVRLASGTPDFTGVTFELDGMDEYGVEQALRLREAGIDAEVVAVGYGPAGSEHVLRTALAMGVDRAVQLEGDELFDPLAVATALADVTRELGASLVLVGGKQADWDSTALGPALAEALGWPHVDWATELRLDGERFEAVHDVDDGSETVRGELPLVVTAQQGLNEPRYATLPGMMKARRKPLEVRPAGAPASRVQLRSFERLERERRGVVLDGDPREAATELLRRLRDEARVL